MTQPVSDEKQIPESSSIEFYGASWCGDCRRSKFVLDKLHIPYIYHDIENEAGAAQVAASISGQKHIPVIQFDDGSFQVEPSTTELIAKVNERGLVPPENN